MSNYLISDDVEVFPSSLRAKKFGSVYTSEKNLTNMVKVNTDFNNYVVSDNLTIENNRLKGSISFVIQGYYFEVINISSLQIDPRNGFHFSIKTSDNYEPNQNFINLVTQENSPELDANGQFLGLYCDEGTLEDSNILNIFGTVEDDKFIIDDSCYIKYLSDNISYTKNSYNRVPRITSKKLPNGDISLSDYPKDPKSGDIFIIYK